jgi:acyl-CoA thioester hydrolase
MPYEYKAVHRVEFAETDMAGIVHFSNFFHYMEIAEHSFFRSIGFSIVSRDVETPVGWPRVHAHCDFKQPLHFEDEVEIHMLVSDKKSKSLTYLFRIRRLNPVPIVEVARGTITVVCVKRTAEGKMAATNLPKEIADQIEVAPEQLLK